MSKIRLKQLRTRPRSYDAHDTELGLEPCPISKACFEPLNILSKDHFVPIFPPWTIERRAFHVNMGTAQLFKKLLCPKSDSVCVRKSHTSGGVMLASRYWNSPSENPSCLSSHMLAVFWNHITNSCFLRWTSTSLDIPSTFALVKCDLLGVYVKLFPEPYSLKTRWFT